MIHGLIDNGLHPRLLITLQTQDGEINVRALLDSGFDGQVALPYIVADHRQFEVVRLAEVTYANGQKAEEIVCRGNILWHNQHCSVEILLSDDEEPAIGTGLLKGCIVTMNFIHDSLSIAKPS